MPINLPTTKLFVFINGSFVNNKDFIYLFIAQFSPFFRSMQATAYLYRKNPYKGEKPKYFLLASFTRSAFT